MYTMSQHKAFAWNKSKGVTLPGASSYQCQRSKCVAVKIENETLKKKNAELEKYIKELNRAARTVLRDLGLTFVDILRKISAKIDVDFEELATVVTEVARMHVSDLPKSPFIDEDPAQDGGDSDEGESRERVSTAPILVTDKREKSVSAGSVSSVSDSDTASVEAVHLSVVQSDRKDEPDTDEEAEKESDHQDQESEEGESADEEDQEEADQEGSDNGHEDQTDEQDEKGTENQPAEDEDAGFTAIFEPLPVYEIDSSDSDSSSDSSEIIIGSTPAQIAVPTDCDMKISPSSESDPDYSDSDVEISMNIAETTSRRNRPTRINSSRIKNEENAPANPANSPPSTSRANSFSRISETRPAGNAPSNNNQTNRSSSLSDITNSRDPSQNTEKQPKPRPVGRPRKRAASSSPPRPTKSPRRETSVPESAFFGLPRGFVNYSTDPIARPGYIIQHPTDYFPFPNSECEKEKDTSLLHLFTFSMYRDLKDFDNEMTEIQFVQALVLSASIKGTHHYIDVPCGVFVPTERKYIEKLFKQTRPQLINPLSEEERTQVGYKRHQCTVFKVVETKKTTRPPVQFENIDADYFAEGDLNEDLVYHTFILKVTDV